MKEHPGGKSPVTLKDLAAALGYSINTVSRALRDKEDIAPATRERIQRTAREMGYINNTLAASLRLGYTNTIAVILGDVSNAHFAIMMKEIEAYARANGYVSFLLNTDEDSELERKAIQTALNKNVDGIIWCPAQSDGENLALLRETGIPFVLIGLYLQRAGAAGRIPPRLCRTGTCARPGSDPGAAGDRLRLRGAAGSAACRRGSLLGRVCVQRHAGLESLGRSAGARSARAGGLLDRRL